MRHSTLTPAQEPAASPTRPNDPGPQERPLTHAPVRQAMAAGTESPHTDMVMLQKADVWISQFKTRLNIGIIGLVLVWGTVSYFKSTGMQMEARTAPETILADGSDDAALRIEAVEGDALRRGPGVEDGSQEAHVNRPTVKAGLPAPAPGVLQKVKRKTEKKRAAANKNPGKDGRKLKKALAAAKADQ